MYDAAFFGVKTHLWSLFVIMLALAQLVERMTVAHHVEGSNPLSQPNLSLIELKAHVLMRLALRRTTLV